MLKHDQNMPAFWHFETKITTPKGNEDVELPTQ